MRVTIGGSVSSTQDKNNLVSRSNPPILVISVISNDKYVFSFPIVADVATWNNMEKCCTDGSHMHWIKIPQTHLVQLDVSPDQVIICVRVLYAAYGESHNRIREIMIPAELYKYVFREGARLTELWLDGGPFPDRDPLRPLTS